MLRPSISSLNFASSVMLNQMQHMTKDGALAASSNASAGSLYHAPVSGLMIQQQQEHARARAEAVETAAAVHVQSQVRFLSCVFQAVGFE